MAALTRFVALSSGASSLAQSSFHPSILFLRGPSRALLLSSCYYIHFFLVIAGLAGFRIVERSFHPLKRSHLLVLVGTLLLIRRRRLRFKMMVLYSIYLPLLSHHRMLLLFLVLSRPNMRGSQESSHSSSTSSSGAPVGRSGDKR